MIVGQDLIQETMGTRIGFIMGAINDPVIWRDFHYHLESRVKTEDFLAIRTYWNLRTGQPQATLSKAAQVLGISKGTLSRRLRRGQNVIRHQFQHHASDELRAALANYRRE
jgi:helix-turn-helix, Psq domain